MADRLKGIAILVVDDEVDLRDMLVEQLRMEGALLHMASDVSSAIAIAKDQTIDLILSDIVMARGDGVELLKRVPQLAHIPKVILMTGFSRYTPEQLQEHGSVAVLTKPFEFDDLVKEIEKLALKK